MLGWARAAWNPMVAAVQIELVEVGEEGLYPSPSPSPGPQVSVEAMESRRAEKAGSTPMVGPHLRRNLLRDITRITSDE